MTAALMNYYINKNITNILSFESLICYYNYNIKRQFNVLKSNLRILSKFIKRRS